MKTSEHPNEQGPRFIGGKPYFWAIVDGKRVLKAWPNDPDGIPVRWEYLTQGEQT